jgi:hypothetical protein
VDVLRTFPASRVNGELAEPNRCDPVKRQKIEWGLSKYIVQ